MNNNRTSIIWTISKEEFIDKINKSNSLPDLLESFGFNRRGGATYKTIYKRAEEEGIDLDKVRKRWLENRNNNLIKKAKSLSEILVEQSNFSTYHLKNRLLNENILENKCDICGLGAIWNNKPISLQLDHINGVRTDNRLENLRILCPNCHTQTETWGMGQRKRKRKEKVHKPRKRNVEWPSKEQLEEEIDRKVSFVALGKKYGVSDNAVRKWCRHYKIGKWKE